MRWELTLGGRLFDSSVSGKVPYHQRIDKILNIHTHKDKLTPMHQT